MTFLLSQLSDSILLKPVKAWAFKPASAIQTCLTQGQLPQTLHHGLHRITQFSQTVLPQWFNPLLSQALCLNLLLLAVASTFMETTPIGLLALSAGLLTLIGLLTNPNRPAFNALDASVSLFFLSALLSAAFSSYPHTTIEGVVKFTSFASGYAAFRYALYLSPQRINQYIGLLMCLGLGQALIGFYQNTHQVSALATWQDPTIDPQLQLTRVFGTLKPLNPNLLAGYLLPILGIAGGISIASAFANHWKKALPAIGVSVAIACGVVLTGSRGGYLSLGLLMMSAFLVSGHWLWHHPALKQGVKLKALWVLVAAGVTAAVALAFSLHAGLKNRLMSIFSFEQDSSNLYRITVWHSALRMAADNWLVGIGPGNDTFKQVYGLYMVPGFSALGSYCVPLEIAVEQGLIGLFAFLLLLITTLFRLGKALHKETDFVQLGILLGCLLGIIAAVGYGAFDTVWYRPSVNLLFWSLVALSASVTERYLD